MQLFPVDNALCRDSQFFLLPFIAKKVLQSINCFGIPDNIQ